MTRIDAIVIGGGQAGLAAARALREKGQATVVLEAGDEPVGSWPSYTTVSPCSHHAATARCPGWHSPATRTTTRTATR